MAPSRAGVWSLAILSLVLLPTFNARAELIVVTSPGEPPALAYAEVALASGEGSRATWLSLRVRRGPVAIVAALPEDASSEPALDAWLTALERSASPQVLPPKGATDCGKSSSSVPVRWPRSKGIGAEELNVERPEDVAALLEEHGLGEGLHLPQTARYVVWSWPTSLEDVTTTTWRISGGDATVSFSPAPGWPVLVNALSPRPLSLPGEAELEQLRVTFVAGKPGTDYLQKLEAWMARERAPLLEARSSGTVFGWSILTDTVSRPPLVTSYARAAAEEDDVVDVDDCVDQLQTFERGEAPSATACGRATDASVAFSVTGAHPVLQRFVLSGPEAIGLESFEEGGEPRSAVLRAERLDDSGCPVTMTEPPPVVLVPNPNGGAPSTGQGGRAPVGVGETVVVEETYVGESCSCSPRPDPDYQERQTVHCSGDTSSSSDDGCSSDTSSSSDDGCSSDTSSSSDDGCSSDTSSNSDDGCSSDTSSSSDDGCSSSSDRSYDGDTCTGRAAPGADPKPARATSSLSRTDRPRRLRFSLWSVAFAAALLPIRRRNGRGRGSG